MIIAYNLEIFETNLENAKILKVGESGDVIKDVKYISEKVEDLKPHLTGSILLFNDQPSIPVCIVLISALKDLVKIIGVYDHKKQSYEIVLSNLYNIRVGEMFEIPSGG